MQTTPAITASRSLSPNNDDFGRLELVEVHRRNGQTLTTPEVTRYSYDLVGNLSRINNANGVSTTYAYDAAGRLGTMTHYAPDATPLTLADNPRLAEYVYSYQADGRKTAALETRWENGSPLVDLFAWTYDNNGRLVQEACDSHDNPLDFTADYLYDLVGNRLSKETDRGSNGSVDETVTSAYDVDDQLLAETTIVGQVDSVQNGETDDTTAAYSTSGGNRISRSLTRNIDGAPLQSTSYDYDVRGRLEETVVETYDGAGHVVRRDTSTYRHDDKGRRVGSTEKIEIDDDNNPATPLAVESFTDTSDLVNPRNTTGYSQIIKSITRDAVTQQILGAKVYSIGLDVLSQTDIVPDSGLPGSPLFLLYDGHGSTRLLTDMAASVALNGSAKQIFLYDAFGNPIGFNPALALTQFLYSGERFDARTNLQHLRDRDYDPRNGSFTQRDRYAGDITAPQTLHKLIYTHNDPINASDPSGQTAIFAIFGLLGIGFGAGYFGARAFSKGASWHGIARDAMVGGTMAGMTGLGVGLFFTPFSANAALGVGAIGGAIFGNLLGDLLDLSLEVNMFGAPGGIIGAAVGAPLAELSPTVVKFFTSLGLFILGGLSTYYEFRGAYEKDTAIGKGGTRVDKLLPSLRNDIFNKYVLLPQNKREALASQMNGLHGPSDALGSWDIPEMYKTELKMSWSEQLQGVAPNNRLHETLSYHGMVFAAEEVNYVLFGMLNHEAWIKGVMTGVTNYFSSLSTATLYRTTFGGVLSALLDSQGISVKYETATGKVAFVDHGWDLTLASVLPTGVLDAIPPVEASLGDGASASGLNYNPALVNGQNKLRFHAGKDGPNGMNGHLIFNF